MGAMKAAQQRDGTAYAGLFPARICYMSYLAHCNAEFDVPASV